MWSSGGMRGIDSTPARGAAKPRARPTVMRRAAEPLRSVRPVQGVIALGLGAVLLNVLSHRQPRLELHLIDGYVVAPLPGKASKQVPARIMPRDSWLSVAAN
jgi:hypothetical protein